MSLVNDMLRDLDKRRAVSPTLSSSPELSPAARGQAVASGRAATALAVLAAVLFGTAAWYWLGTRGEQHSEVNRELASGVDSSVRMQSAELAGGAPIESVPPQSVSEPSPSLPRTGSRANPSEESEQPREAEVVAQPPSPMAEQRASSQSIQATGGDETLPSSALEERTEALSSAQPLAQPLAQPSAQPLAQLPSQAQPAKEEPAPMRVVDELSPAQLDIARVQEALALLAASDDEVAFELLEAHIEAAPLAHQSRETLIKLLISRDEFAKAEMLSDAGLALVANHAGFKKAKARLLIQREDYIAAADVLAARAPSASADPEYFELLASAQLAAADFQGSAQSYRQLIESDRSQSRWWYGLGISQERLGNTQQAIQAYRQALGGRDLSASLRRRSLERVNLLSGN